MIYLIKQPSFKIGCVLLKIGYAEDVNYRFSQYVSHCPWSYLISVRSGDRITENILHKYFHSLPGIQYIRNEWYQVSSEEYGNYQKEFHRPLEFIEKSVWNQTRNLSDVSNSVLQYLYDKYGPNRMTYSERRNMKESLELVLNDETLPLEVVEFYRVYSSLTRASDRLKLLCEVSLTPEVLNVVLEQIPDTDRVKSIFLMAGPDLCRANSYIPTEIEKAIGVKYYSKNNLKAGIYGKFQVGQKYDLKSVKEELTSLYNDLSYQKTPKAKDLEEFFEVKKFQSTDPTTKKRVHGYELIKKLL